MGYDLDKFVDPVDDELLCSICTDVLEDAVSTPCQHLYCKSCLEEWLSRKSTCPVDGLPINRNRVTPGPRSIQNMLSRLKVRCDHCQQVLPISKQRTHNCFQDILSEMVDYIQQFDDILLVLEFNKMKVSKNG